MSTPVRIGAVNYLNTKPLIHDLERLAREAELVLDVPSRLADGLADGRLDVALIPVIEYFRGGPYTVVPDIAIASRGPVLSVTLFSRVPWTGVRRDVRDLEAEFALGVRAYAERGTARQVATGGHEGAIVEAFLLEGLGLASQIGRTHEPAGVDLHVRDRGEA